MKKYSATHPYSVKIDVSNPALVRAKVRAFNEKMQNLGRKTRLILDYDDKGRIIGGATVELKADAPSNGSEGASK